MRDQEAVTTVAGTDHANFAAQVPPQTSALPTTSPTPSSPSSAPSPSSCAATQDHYLKTELYQLIQQDPSIFEFLQSGSLDGIWYWDLEHTEHEWLSPRFKKIFGFEDHEVPNTSAWWQERIFAEDLPIALGNFAQHCEDPNHPYDHVVRYRHRDGSTVWVRCRGMAIRDDGRPVRLLGAHTDVTAFKLAEEQLRAAERKYRDLYDNSPDMYMSVDAASGIITECNQTLAYLTGYDKQEVIGRPVADFFAAESGTTVSRLMSTLGSAAGNQIAELSMLRKHQSTIPVLLTTHAVLDAAGNVVEHRLSCRDIQQLKHLEKLDLFLKAAPIAAVMADHLGKIVLVNAETERIFGYTQAELLGQPVELLVPQNLRDLHRDHRQRFHANPQGIPMHGRDLFAQRKDGTEFPVEIGLNLAETPEGTRTIASIVDVTERRHAEELRKEAARANSNLAAIVEFSEDAIVGKDMEGVVTSWNAAAQNLFGYTRQEMVGQSTARITPTGRLDEEEAILARISRGESIRHFETQRFNKNGDLIDLSVTISAIRDAEGNIVGTSRVARDITQDKRAQAELVKRTEELARSNRDLEQFAYVASHDLHEPLRAVAGSVALLQRRYTGKLDAKADEFITHAVEGAARMQRLIDDLLAFSRVGSRGGEFRITAAQSALDDAMKNLRQAIQESGAEITFDQLPELTADPSQLTMLFQNLLGNAIKFHGTNPPRIHVSAERQESQWVLSVKDHGIGIDPKYFDRIFNIFQRLHTRLEYPGTGVGLAICKRIMERHNGSICVESTPGECTTFLCAFPAEPLPEPKLKARQSTKILSKSN